MLFFVFKFYNLRDSILIISSSAKQIDILPDQAIYTSNDPSKQNNGKIISNQKYPILDFFRFSNTQPDLPRGCLGYYIGYIRDRKLLSSNCLAAYSSWMQDMYEKIKDSSIHDLMLPGKFLISLLQIRNLFLNVNNFFLKYFVQIFFLIQCNLFLV